MPPKFSCGCPVVGGQVGANLQKIEDGERIHIDCYDDIGQDDRKNHRDEMESVSIILEYQLTDHVNAYFDTLGYEYSSQIEFGGDGTNGYATYQFQTDKIFHMRIPVMRITVYGVTQEIDFGDYGYWEDEDSEEDS